MLFRKYYSLLKEIKRIFAKRMVSALVEGRGNRPFDVIYYLQFFAGFDLIGVERPYQETLPGNNNNNKVLLVSYTNAVRRLRYFSQNF